MAPKCQEQNKISGHGILGKGHNWLISPPFFFFFFRVTGSATQQGSFVTTHQSLGAGNPGGFRAPWTGIPGIMKWASRCLGSLATEQAQNGPTGKEREREGQNTTCLDLHTFFLSFFLSFFLPGWLRREDASTQGAYRARCGMDSKKDYLLHDLGFVVVMSYHFAFALFVVPGFHSLFCC